VLETILEEDRTALCGPRYAHVANRQASRAGTVGSEVVLGGRKLAVRSPRVRADGGPPYRCIALGDQHFASACAQDQPTPRSTRMCP
jgi:hypothetical protein